MKAFSLLEVLIAMAIMGLALVNLFESQARSIRLASKGRALTIATQLARQKLVDCKADLRQKGFATGDYEREGNFEEAGYPDIKWECHGLRFNMLPPNDEQIKKAIQFQSSGSGGAAAEMGIGAASNFLAPMFGSLSNTLGDSIRELVVIIRYEEAGIQEELKVVTHLVDPRPLAGLAEGLSSPLGAQP